MHLCEPRFDTSRLQNRYIREPHRLVAVAANGTGIPAHAVVLVASYNDHDSKIAAHLATIAFRESCAISQRAIGESEGWMKILLIAHSSVRGSTIVKIRDALPQLAVLIYEMPNGGPESYLELVLDSMSSLDGMTDRIEEDNLLEESARSTLSATYS